MKLKNIIPIFLCLLINSQQIYSQDTLGFKNFILINHSFSAEKVIAPKDSFATKKYTLINLKGDTLYMFQKLPLTIVHGEAKIYEMGLTELFIHLRKDSCYNIVYTKDKNDLLKSKLALNHVRVAFLYKKANGEITNSDTLNLILYSVKKVSVFPKPPNNSYQSSLDTLQKLLKDASPTSFKKAVFITENTYNGDILKEENFYHTISILSNLAKGWVTANPLKDYKQADSLNFNTNFAIYKLLKDTVKVELSEGRIFNTKPYTYDFDDFFGQSNWSNMFVTKLLITHKGNCHSFPYLYKILADELGATCWLSFAPNHMYIKNRCKKVGWYNTELTSGEFPIDAWIATSGYVPVDAIRNGIYMDTLSNQQAIAQCVLDLAKGYEFQTKNYYDGFIIKCCDLTLQYHPLNVQAILLKAETIKRIYEKQKSDKDSQAVTTYNQMEQLYIKLFELGYREMPEKMYMQWLRSVTQQHNKYGNKALKATLNKH